MRTNTIDHAATQFRVLSEDQIQRLYLAALEILESTGTRIHEDETMSLLTDAGATRDGDIVRIPAGLVKDMLASVPPRIAVGNREGQRTMILESHRIYYGTGSDCPFIFDAETGERRRFVKTDIEDAARVVDACPNLDFLMSLGLMSEVPTYSYDRHQAAAMMRNTVKPLVLTSMSRQGLSDIIDMYCLLRGDRDALAATRDLWCISNRHRRWCTPRRRWRSCCSPPSGAFPRSTRPARWAAPRRRSRSPG